MANIKISQLPALSQLTANVQFPVANANVTYATTSAVMQAYMATYPSGTFTASVFSASGNIISGATLRGANLSVTGTATVPTPISASANTQVATTAFVASALTSRIPSGVIVMWSGSIASVPSGWYLCNGTNGTPDLRNKFIIGASVDSLSTPQTTITGTNTSTGGSKDSIVVSHTHNATSTDSGHSHTQNLGGAGSQPGLTTSQSPVGGSSITNLGFASITTTISSAGTSGTNANLPPYYALAYIMKA